MHGHGYAWAWVCLGIGMHWVEEVRLRKAPSFIGAAGSGDGAAEWALRNRSTKGTYPAEPLTETCVNSTLQPVQRCSCGWALQSRDWRVGHFEPKQLRAVDAVAHHQSCRSEVLIRSSATAVRFSRGWARDSAAKEAPAVMRPFHEWWARGAARRHHPPFPKTRPKKQEAGTRTSCSSAAHPCPLAGFPGQESLGDASFHSPPAFRPSVWLRE
jgi:hypothetical protein